VIKLSAARLRMPAILLPFLVFAAVVSAPAGLPAPARDLPTARFQNAGTVPYGLLWLDVDPAHADVALDGSHLDAGVWLISVAPGRHDLRVRLPGYRTYYSRFVIDPGQNLHLEVRLQAGADGGL
jgi:hypothetical protein